MTFDTLHTITFSPTGASSKIAEAAARGIGAAQNIHHNTTRQAIPTTHLPHNTVALFAAPVYGGKVAPAALQRFEALRGDRTPALLVVSYGNRAFEGALRELAEFVKARGFIPVAGAACVGEHSYSTREHPIATGRPNAHDLAQAEAWGVHAAEKLSEEGVSELDMRKLRQPASGFWSQVRFIRFVLKYRRHQKKHPIVRLPATDDTCTGCGHCVELCPTQAIEPGNERHTDATRCIRCCACVKGCPQHARTYTTPFASALARSFARPKPNIFLPKR